MIPERKLSRREFLRTSIVAGVGLLLEACTLGSIESPREPELKTVEPTRSPVLPTPTQKATEAPPSAVIPRPIEAVQPAETSLPAPTDTATPTVALTPKEVQSPTPVPTKEKPSLTPEKATPEPLRKFPEKIVLAKGQLVIHNLGTKHGIVIDDGGFRDKNGNYCPGIGLPCEGEKGYNSDKGEETLEIFCSFDPKNDPFLDQSKRYEFWCKYYQQRAYFNNRSRITPCEGEKWFDTGMREENIAYINAMFAKYGNEPGRGNGKTLEIFFYDDSRKDLFFAQSEILEFWYKYGRQIGNKIEYHLGVYETFDPRRSYQWDRLVFEIDTMALASFLTGYHDTLIYSVFSSLYPRDIGAITMPSKFNIK